jgi:DNA-directed RNA polymerase subunit RPC12/RpoP
MACDLYCPECGDNLGKDTENDALAYCGNCGEKNIYNERGDTDDMSEEDIAKFKAMKRKRGGGRIIRRW